MCLKLEPATGYHAQGNGNGTLLLCFACVLMSHTGYHCCQTSHHVPLKCMAVRGWCCLLHVYSDSDLHVNMLGACANSEPRSDSAKALTLLSCDYDAVNLRLHVNMCTCASSDQPMQISETCHSGTTSVTLSSNTYGQTCHYRQCWTNCLLLGIADCSQCRGQESRRGPGTAGSFNDNDACMPLSVI